MSHKQKTRARRSHRSTTDIQERRTLSAVDMGCVDTMQVKANSLMLALTMSALLVVRADGAGSCKAFTCSVRKQAEDSCQCNPHCRVHKDCCSDYEAICPNTTDPSLLRKAAARRRLIAARSVCPSTT